MAASHCTYTSRNAQAAVQNRYARWPIASPSAKYSNSASTIISASASATHAVEPHSTRPTTNGIKMTAVATRFQVMEKESPPNCAKNVNRGLWSAAVFPPLYLLKEPLKKLHLTDRTIPRRVPLMPN